jgi:hypothetical protein
LPPRKGAAEAPPLPLLRAFAIAPGSRGSSINISKALIAHNAFGLPLAPRVKFSENSQLLELGDGLWNTASAPGTYKLYVSDQESGQAGFLGTVRENDTTVALALRLKIENRRIGEIETVVLRGGNPNTRPPPDFHGPITVINR